MLNFRHFYFPKLKITFTAISVPKRLNLTDSFVFKNVFFELQSLVINQNIYDIYCHFNTFICIEVKLSEIKMDTKRAEDFDLTKEQIDKLLGRMDYLRDRYYSNDGSNVSYQELVSAVRLIAEYVGIANPKIELVSNEMDIFLEIDLFTPNLLDLADVEIRKHYQNNKIYDKSEKSLIVHIEDITHYKEDKAYFRFHNYNTPAISYVVGGDFLQIFRDLRHQAAVEDKFCENASLLKYLFERSDFRSELHDGIFGSVDPEQKEVKDNEVIQLLNFLYCNYEDYVGSDYRNAIWLYDALRFIGDKYLHEYNYEINKILDAAVSLNQADFYFIVNTEGQITIYPANEERKEDYLKNYKNTVLIKGQEIEFFTNHRGIYRDGFHITAHKYSEEITDESYLELFYEKQDCVDEWDEPMHRAKTWYIEDEIHMTNEFGDFSDAPNYGLSLGSLNFTIQDLKRTEFYAIFVIYHKFSHLKYLPPYEFSSIRDKDKPINCSLLRTLSCNRKFFKDNSTGAYNINLDEEESPQMARDDEPILSK